MGRFDIFPIFIATFASRRVTLIATHSKSQKQTRLPIRYLYFILPFKPLINKEVIKVFQNYIKYFPNSYFTGGKCLLYPNLAAFSLREYESGNKNGSGCPKPFCHNIFRCCRNLLPVALCFPG